MKTKPLLLSLKPCYAELVFQGLKRAELRRRIPCVENRDVFIYVSSPVRCLRGGFRVEHVWSGSPEQVWKKVERLARVERREFDAYYAGRSVAYAMRISKVWEYDEPVHLEVLRRQLSDLWRHVRGSAVMALCQAGRVAVFSDTGVEFDTSAHRCGCEGQRERGAWGDGGTVAAREAGTVGRDERHMPIDAQHLWRHVALGEDTEIELKEARFRGDRVVGPKRDDLADGLAALANGRGGRLVLGVTDERRPQGLDPEQLDALADLVTEICSDSVTPPLDFSLFRVAAPGPPGGGALVVELPEGATVHRSPGGHFRRRGNRKRLMDAAEVRRLAQARGQSDVASTDTQVVRSTGVNSLKPELWRQYASSRADEPAEVALSKLKFVKDDRHGALRATVGGVLLAADDPREWLPNAWIQAVCYGGFRMDAGRQIDAQDIAGPLDRQIRDAMRFVVRNRRVPFKQRSRTRPAPTCRSSANARSSRRWSTPLCTATTRCRGRAYGCSCSTTGWSCTRPAGCATR